MAFDLSRLQATVEADPDYPLRLTVHRWWSPNRRTLHDGEARLWREGQDLWFRYRPFRARPKTAFGLQLGALTCFLVGIGGLIASIDQVGEARMWLMTMALLGGLAAIAFLRLLVVSPRFIERILGPDEIENYDILSNGVLVYLSEGTVGGVRPAVVILRPEPPHDEAEITNLLEWGRLPDADRAATEPDIIARTLRPLPERVAVVTPLVLIPRPKAVRNARGEVTCDGEHLYLSLQRSENYGGGLAVWIALGTVGAMGFLTMIGAANAANSPGTTVGWLLAAPLALLPVLGLTAYISQSLRHPMTRAEIRYQHLLSMAVASRRVQLLLHGSVLSRPDPVLLSLKPVPPDTLEALVRLFEWRQIPPKEGGDIETPSEGEGYSPPPVFSD